MGRNIRLLLAIAAGIGMIGGALVPASAWPTPGLNGEVTEMALGRVFPEAANTNDYIGYHEAISGLNLLNAQFPDLMELHMVGQSYGWPTVTGGHATYDVPLVELTNENSAITFENKTKVFFMLSIHGNEKGGREGGLRVIEDLLKGIGLGEEVREGGTSNETYSDILEYMVAIFLFPNPDGWAHDEPEHLQTPGGAVAGGGAGGCVYGTPWYCRTNGNGVDLNREAPTVGWVRERYTPLSEPESKAYIPFIQDRYTNLAYASDIHGMLSSDHFILTLLPAGSFNPQEMLRSTRAAELLKDLLNNNPEFAGWTSLPNDNPVGERAWGGEFNDWGTVWDTIGYTDSGFSGDWFAQDSGLNTPGYDIEMAYNHVTFDSHYMPLGMAMNIYHVEAVRDIMAVFIDSAARDVRVSIETQGTQTGYLVNPFVAASQDDAKPMGGWAAENPDDDPWDYMHTPFTARPSKYFEDLAPFLADGEQPGHLAALTPPQLTADELAGLDNLIISGTALTTIQDDAAKVKLVLDWVNGGGNLVLTDSALKFLELAGLAKAGSVDNEPAYAGYTNFFDRGHKLLSEVRGIARQTYEPVPLGFDITALSAPNWYVDESKANLKGLDKVGAIGGDSQVNLGIVTAGSGTIHFLGSLLPDPSEEFYHPYGLDSYATTYTGNALVRAMLGWDQTFAQPPLVVQGGQLVATEPAPERAPLEGQGGEGVEGAAKDNAVPGPGLFAALAAVGAALLLAGRRRQ